MEVLVEIVVSSGVILGLLKGFPSFFFAKSLEKHKAKLNKESDAAIAKLNADLRIQAFKHEKSFTILQEKRALVIEELYFKLCECIRFIGSFVNSEFIGEEDKDEKAKKVVSAISEFSAYFESKKIYFDSSFCDSVDKVFHNAADIAIDCGINGYASGKDKRDAFRANFSKMQNEVYPLLRKLAEDFRALLGVSGKMDPETSSG